MNKKLLKPYIAPSVIVVEMKVVNMLCNISGRTADGGAVFTDGGDATEGGSWDPW